MSTFKNSIRNLPGKDEEQTIRTLARYYPLDEGTNTFEIGLHYEKASDLFEENTDTLEKVSRISDSIPGRMSEILDDIPDGYSADVSIRVDDYEGYSPEQLMNGIKDALFFHHRRFIHETTRNGIKTGSLIVAGVVMILILTIGRQIGWWSGEDTVSEILTFMLDTLGTVLIWEGFSIIFIQESEEYGFERKISRKVSSISFCQGGRDRAATRGRWENISALIAVDRKKLIMRRLLLVGGFSLICLMAAWVLQTLGIIINPEVFGEKVTLELILDMLVAILVGAAGVLSLYAYKGKLRNSPIVLALAAVILYPLINAFIMLFRDGSTLAPIETILAIFIIVAGLIFLTGYGMYYIQSKRDSF
ncbi:MAG: hypothetical protein IJ608_13260 [Lachnospiraceae bacterium]|nr:hypothetical protein [Lachnospiraceae bacterium]